MKVALLAVAACCLFYGTSAGSVFHDRSLASCDSRTFNPLQPAITKAPIVDLKWVDKNDLRVFGVTQKVSSTPSGGLWMSKDGGKSWAEKTAELASSSGSSEPFEIISILVQKSKPDNVVVMGSGSFMWVSNDYGTTLTPKKNMNGFRGSSIKSLRMHPWHDDHLLVLVKRPDCKIFEHSMQECPYDLMMTKDLFGDLTWTNLTEKSGKIGGFVDFDWAANLCPQGKEGCKNQEHLYHDDAIFATLYVHDGDYDEPWDPDVHFVMSENFFQDYDILVKCGNMFELVAGGVYLAWSNKCDKTPDHQSNDEAKNFPMGITLYTSITGGHEFIRACLPVALKQEGYELMETHDGTGAIVIVDFSISAMQMDLPSSSVYTAGPHQALFSLSMTDLNHNNFGFSKDFARVEGMPGVYIANQMTSRLPTSEQTDDSYYYDYYASAEFLSSALIETQMTFNGGGKWQRIPAPKSFTYTKCNRCEGSEKCYLHLNGMAEWNSLDSMPSVYSSVSAPGVMMGVGNVAAQGSGLGDNDGTCTWLSTDGGVTWKDVADGIMIYEYADWGSTIVMAQFGGLQGKPTAEVKFSVDGGSCWYSVPLTTALLVENIRIEPDGQRPRVIVHGSSCRQPDHPQCSYREDDTSSQVQGLMYTLDVTDLMPGTFAMCGNADYEQWGVPTSGSDKSVRCILGRQSRVKRRILGHTCLNGPDFVRGLPDNTTCPCTQESDLECDYGFLKAGAPGGNGATMCIQLPKDRMPKCPELNKGQYMVSETGYRMVHADVCTGADQLINDTDGKGTPLHPGSVHVDPNYKGKKHGSVFYFFMFVLICAALAGAFVAWWRFLATESHRDTVRDLAGGVASFCTSLYLWIVEKIRGRSYSNTLDQDLGYFQPLGEVPEHEAGVFTIK